ncbi:molecular chaperone GrpE [Ulvibacter sp. MAR_2010_11]|uniref:nucleotide exchange factor GrpE n=1 Tax=Ulvibacter sp. MAR_2010_11 TaxID=1250229 RepID=UPI000C2B624D|nr:nucleotide exchange factor GrpE [Ulvibacter sp. MAR_2010_11]PKA82185.1 molecular chaperone GrpE [Ulvibacter sp. MAR_2010_11]
MSRKDKNKEVAVEEKVQTKEQATSDIKSKKEKVDPVKQLQMELEGEKDRYLRLFAEFENYKKRTGRERIELFKTAGQDVIVALLPIMDDFDRALKEIEKAEDDNLFKGVELISNKFRETMRAKGLEVIGTQQGDIFNADLHEAITQIPAPSEDLKGKIIDVIEKGYTLGEKIIRYPKVVIGQ